MPETGATRSTDAGIGAQAPSTMAVTAIDKVTASDFMVRSFRADLIGMRGLSETVAIRRPRVFKRPNEF
jgi:hypothetical protein